MDDISKLQAKPVSKPKSTARRQHKFTRPEYGIIFVENWVQCLSLSFYNSGKFMGSALTQVVSFSRIKTIYLYSVNIQGVHKVRVHFRKF